MNKSHDNTNNPNYILLRKNSETDKKNSVIVWEMNEKKITINITDDKEFLKKDKLQSNLIKMKNDYMSEKFLVRVDKSDIEEGRVLKKRPQNIDIEGEDFVKKAINNETINEPNIALPVYPQFRIITPTSKGMHSVKSILTEMERRVHTHGSAGAGHDNVNRMNDIRVVTNQSEDEINEFFKFCFLCDKLHLSNTMITVGCNHAFCQKCGKVFFEDKIEQGDSLLKCPVFKCQKAATNHFLKSLVTEKHLNLFLNNQNGDNSLKDSKYDEVRVYTQKHILDINNNDNFLLYNKTKEHFCQKCTEASLYGRTGKTYVKCLNCFNTFCKFCMKNYNYDHLDITSDSYCKVFFRKDLKKQSVSPNKCKLYLLTLGMVIASYLLCVMALYRTIYTMFNRERNSINKHNNTLCKKFKYYTCNISLFLLYIIIFPILLMIIPYFPIITMMLN